MEPDRDISGRVQAKRKQATPRGAGQKSHGFEPPGGPIGVHLQIFLYTALAAFSLAVFFYGASLLVAHVKFTGNKPINTITRETPVGSAATFRQIAFTDQQILTVGIITSPVPYSIADRTVTLTGNTAHVPVDTPVVWLIAGRCRPQKPIIQPNGTFQATVFEGGPNMDYTVSLYAVGFGHNKTIERWLDAGSFGGLPVIPQQYRLDSVRLVLDGV